MANRRCLQTVARLYSSATHPSASLTSLKVLTLRPQSFAVVPEPRRIQIPKSSFSNTNPTLFPHNRSFSSSQRRDGDEDDESEYDDDEEDESEYDGEGNGEEMAESGDDENVSSSGVRRECSLEERESEAAAIGYKVTGQLQRSDQVFKPYEPVFAIVQIGSHQFKVSNGDCIFTERLKFCEVNDKLILSKVLMLGSNSQTLIGRPILLDAAVHAVVEEHALDAKVIIFKKKRRKNYRRKNGHRQELTKLRITDVLGIEKPGLPTPLKTEKTRCEKVESVAIAA